MPERKVVPLQWGKMRSGDPPEMSETMSAREIQQAMRIQELESERKLAIAEERLEQTITAIEVRLDRSFTELRGDLKAMDQKFEERTRFLDWKLNLLIGGMVTLILATIVMPYLKPEPPSAPAQAPVIINMPGGAQIVPPAKPATR